MRIKVLNCSNYSFYSHATLQHFDILSLHDALPISGAGLLVRTLENLKSINPGFDTHNILLFTMDPSLNGRSEEHTSELQSRGHLVCRLLLEKKKEKYYYYLLLNLISHE